MKTGLRIKAKVLLESCTQRAVHKACKKIQHKFGKLKQSSSTKISQIPNNFFFITEAAVRGRYSHFRNLKFSIRDFFDKCDQIG